MEKLIVHLLRVKYKYKKKYKLILVINMDIIVYIAIIFAIIVRVVIMRGSFVLPTIYKHGNEMTFNLGSLSTIIIGFAAALTLMYSSPESFANPLIAFITTYSVPQLVDGIATFGVRNALNVDESNTVNTEDIGIEDISEDASIEGISEDANIEDISEDDVA